VVPSERVAVSGNTQIALGEVGQYSSHTMHGISMAQGRHLPRSKNAVPILIGFSFLEVPRGSSMLTGFPSFSASVIFQIAPVGHTWLHKTQLYSQ
jgi:hypothetical protein